MQLGDISMHLFYCILYLNSKWCNILSLVDVVVQAGGQGQEAVGGDVEVLHHVSIEREREEIVSAPTIVSDKPEICVFTA